MRPDPLQRFRAAKLAEIADLERQAEQGGLPPYLLPRPGFRDALERPAAPLAVIAEYKRASPSRGVICASVTPEEAARQYAQNGAAALSILTEQAHFQGDVGFLARMAPEARQGKRTLPLLRKDFIFHPLQVTATAATPASALLLIARLTPEVRLLRDLREQAERLGLEAVVEIFDAADLALARESGARLIQVNARDLETLTVDRRAALRLATAHPPQADECWIAASGLRRREDLRDAAAAGFSAALVGTSLMEQGRPGAALQTLLQEDAPC